MADNILIACDNNPNMWGHYSKRPDGYVAWVTIKKGTIYPDGREWFHHDVVKRWYNKTASDARRTLKQYMNGD